MSNISGVPVDLATKIGSGTHDHATIALFVSTCLTSWATEQLHVFARDVQINETAYRRLDPEYYAWLRSRMTIARSANQAGKIDDEDYDELRSRFNGVHEWAMEHFGDQKLSEAVQTLDARNYEPPVMFEQSMRAHSRGVNRAAMELTATVDSIREQALALGWKQERLYATGNGRLFDPSRGLICFLKAGDKIGEITAQAIEIIHPSSSEGRQRFFNPDVDQPWNPSNFE